MAIDLGVMQAMAQLESAGVFSPHTRPDRLTSNNRVEYWEYLLTALKDNEGIALVRLGDLRRLLDEASQWRVGPSGTGAGAAGLRQDLRSAPLDIYSHHAQRNVHSRVMVADVLVNLLADDTVVVLDRRQRQGHLLKDGQLELAEVSESALDEARSLPDRTERLRALNVIDVYSVMMRPSG